MYLLKYMSKMLSIVSLYYVLGIDKNICNIVSIGW